MRHSEIKQQRHQKNTKCKVDFRRVNSLLFFPALVAHSDTRATQHYNVEESRMSNSKMLQTKQAKQAADGRDTAAAIYINPRESPQV